jgi:hypothetical protein
VHPLFERDDEILHCLWRAFCFKLNSSIWQISHQARNLKLLRDLQRGIAKTNSLNAAREKYSFVMNFRHSVEGKTYVPVIRVSIHKTTPAYLHAGILRCILSGRKQLENTAPATP